MTIHLVTFDLDHTLWTPDAALARAEIGSYQWLAQQVPAFAQAYSPEAFVALRASLREQRPELLHRVSEIRRVAFRQALQACGVAEPLAGELAGQAFDVFWQLRQQVDIFAETHALLPALAARYTLGALSNGNACLKTIGLAQHFAFHYAGEDFAAAKPAPDMFLAALTQAGVAAHEAVHIGDHPGDDILGAQAVGMKTVWVNLDQRSWPHAINPDATVTTLPDIPAVLAAFG